MDELKGGFPSEVYSEFESIINEGDLSYDPFGLDSNQNNKDLKLHSTNFRRIDGKDKFYGLQVEDDLVEIAVRVEEFEEHFKISEIRATDSYNETLTKYLEHHFSVGENTTGRTF